MTKQSLFYSPEENHLAVIYTDFFGCRRFSRFATEKDVILFPPLTRRFVFKEIYLGPRTAHIFLSNVSTKDQVHLEVELKIFYKVDPRDASPENLIQVLKMPSAAFESIIRTNTEEKARNTVFIQQSTNDLFSFNGRKDLRKILSTQVAERVQGFGITVNHLYGVAIMNMQPNAIYQKAMQEVSAAEAQGLAAIKRLTASFEKAPALSPEDAQRLVYMQIASAINKTGDIPNVIYPQQSKANGFVEEEIREIQIQRPEAPQHQKGKDERQYPIAAD